MVTKLSMVIPIRKGSTRTLNKNTRAFTPDGKSLTQIKIEELEKVKYADEIVVTTNCDEIENQINKVKKTNKIKVVRRPQELCLDTTLVKDIINYMPTICCGEHILWLHVTSPFVKAEDYDGAIKKYFEELENGYDSLMSVTLHKQFMWSDKKKRIINTDDKVNKWPNTQDLDPLYEINHAFYINSRENYIRTSDRIGNNPYLYELKNEKSIDIDWEEDFLYAQRIYPAIKGLK